MTIVLSLQNLTQIFWTIIVALNLYVILLLYRMSKLYRAEREIKLLATASLKGNIEYMRSNVQYQKKTITAAAEKTARTTAAAASRIPVPPSHHRPTVRVAAAATPAAAATTTTTKNFRINEQQIEESSTQLQIAPRPRLRSCLRIRIPTPTTTGTAIEKQPSSSVAADAFSTTNSSILTTNDNDQQHQQQQQQQPELRYQYDPLKNHPHTVRKFSSSSSIRTDHSDLSPPYSPHPDDEHTLYISDSLGRVVHEIPFRERDYVDALYSVLGDQRWQVEKKYEGTK